MNDYPQTLKGLVDIIILRFNTPEHDKDCVRAIIANTGYPYYQITLFDNSRPRFTPSKIWNMLIARSYGEYICLLNNDTKPSKGWLGKLVEVFERHEKVGAVGPSTNQCGSFQKIGSPINKHLVVDYGKEYGGFCQLSGFCLLFPKEVWWQTGGFDERFGIYGQENDFLHRMRKRGLRTLWRKDAYVWHEGEATGKQLAKEEGFDIVAQRKKGDRMYLRARKKHG